MKKKSIYTILILCIKLCVAPVVAEIIEVSPSGRFAVERKMVKGTLQYSLINIRTKTATNLVNYSEKDPLNIRGVITSWSPNESNVAILVFYGTKLSNIFLFSKDDNKVYKEVSFKSPELVRDKKLKNRASIPISGIGVWSKNNQVNLLTGIYFEEGDSDPIYYLMPYLVTIERLKCHLSKKPSVTLDDTAAMPYLAKWKYEL